MDHRFAGLAGDGRFDPIVRDDVGDSDVAALPADGNPGETYHLTGPEAVTLTEAAEAMRGQYDNP